MEHYLQIPVSKIYISVVLYIGSFLTVKFLPFCAAGDFFMGFRTLIFTGQSPSSNLWRGSTYHYSKKRRTNNTKKCHFASTSAEICFNKAKIFQVPVYRRFTYQLLFILSHSYVSKFLPFCAAGDFLWGFSVAKTAPVGAYLFFSIPFWSFAISLH